MYKSKVSVVNSGSPANAVGMPVAKPLLNLNVFAIYLVLSYIISPMLRSGFTTFYHVPKSPTLHDLFALKSNATSFIVSVRAEVTGVNPKAVAMLLFSHNEFVEL
jgi:hypothetical protein